MRGWSRLVLGCACFLQVAAAAAVMVVTALKLHHVDIQWDRVGWNADVSNTCLLGVMENGGNLCYLAYMAGGVSVAATGLLSLLQCCTCSLCGLGLLLDALFAAGGTLMWAAVATLFNHYNQRPIMAAVPRPEWRESITVLSFVAAALFGLMALAAVYCMLALCCACCREQRKGSKLQGARAQVVDCEAGACHTAAKGQQFIVR